MDKRKNRKKIFHSMMEFEKYYLPRSFEKNMSQKPTDAQALGICLAEESLNKIKERLGK